MKLAIVLYGIAGGTVWRNGLGPVVNHYEVAKILKYNIARHYDCDIFVHSWSKEHEEMLLSAYAPTLHLIQQQEMFGFGGRVEDYTGEGNNGLIFRTISHWVSTERAISLKQQYEKVNNFEYDLVLLSRLDLVYFTKLNLENLDNSLIYVVDEPWHGINPGESKFYDSRSGRMEIYDVAIMSSSKNIDEYCKITREILDQGMYVDYSWDSESISFTKINSMVGGDLSKIVFFVKRHTDVELYRTIVGNFSNGIEQWAMSYCSDNKIDLMENLRNVLNKIDGVIPDV